MSDQNEYRGYWSLLCDNETESSACSTGIRTMLKELIKLHEKFPKLFPIPAEAKKFQEVDNLLVYTAGNSDEDIEKSAEAIRSIVDFPFVMSYFTRSPKECGKQYEHTPGGDLYKKCEHPNPAGSRSHLIGKKAKSTAGLNELLPSQLIDKDYIHLPANEEDFQKITDKKGGKWMVHCSDLDTLDNFWKSLIRLYVRGGIVGLKSYTTKSPIANVCPKYTTKAILCYTSDAECKLSVRRAAQSIFLCTGYSYPMFYKATADSLAGKYHHEGVRKVSKYMYTNGGELFEKDYLGRWKKVFFDEENHK